MKKLITLIIVMVLALAGCANSKSGNTVTSTPTSTAPPANTLTAEESTYLQDSATLMYIVLDCEEKMIANMETGNIDGVIDNCVNIKTAKNVFDTMDYPTSRCYAFNEACNDFFYYKSKKVDHIVAYLDYAAYSDYIEVASCEEKSNQAFDRMMSERNKLPKK